MHADEVATDASLVGALVARQFPQWSGLPIAAVPSSGTDHAIYPLGENPPGPAPPIPRGGDPLGAPLPRTRWAVGQSAREAEWLPRLSPYLPLAVPVPLGIGLPDLGYSFPWAVYEWLPGEPADRALRDQEQA